MAEHSVAGHSMAEPSVGEHSMGEHSVAEHSMGEHSMAQHSTVGTSSQMALAAPEPACCLSRAAQHWLALHCQYGTGI